jgi:hypothetical protein
MPTAKPEPNGLQAVARALDSAERAARADAMRNGGSNRHRPDPARCPGCLLKSARERYSVAMKRHYASLPMPTIDCTEALLADAAIASRALDAVPAKPGMLQSEFLNAYHASEHADARYAHWLWLRDRYNATRRENLTGATDIDGEQFPIVRTPPRKSHGKTKN